MQHLTVFTVAILLLTAQLSHAESPPPKYTFGIGLEMFRGSFGTDSTSTFVATPLIIDWYPTQRLDFELTVPFLYLRASGSSELSTSTSKSVARGNMGGTGARLNGAGGTVIGAGGTIITTDTAGADSEEYGMGDITLTSGYALLVDSDTTPLLRPTVYLKFPTADENKGFGTGKFDYGVGLAVSKWFGNWQPFTEGRYIFQGASKKETGALDFLTADAGVAYGWSDSFVTSAYARFGTNSFEGMTSPLEARLKMVWRFEERTFTEAYALKGLSDGSPDYGGGVSIFREF